MIRRAQPWLGTMVEISVVDAADAGMSAVNVAIDGAFAAVATVHRSMCFHDPASDVSTVNRLAIGASCAVSPHMATVLHCALLLESASEGLFNIACADLLTRWGYLPRSALANDVDACDGGEKGLQRGAVTVTPEGMVTRLHPGSIDLGGIAKGYAVDLAVQALVDAGVSAGLVNAGGDMRAFGPRNFPVLLRDPAQPALAALQLTLCEQALATSAGYFSQRSYGTGSVTALVDGTTGRSVTARRSASVQAHNCMLADGLTKIVIASGNESHPLLARFAATAILL